MAEGKNKQLMCNIDVMEMMMVDQLVDQDLGAGEAKKLFV